MKISFKGSFKSLSDFESEELPNFTVIIGKNGSGKSQLVEMFKFKSSGSFPSDTKFEIQPNLKNIKVNDFATSEFSSMDNSHWKNVAQNFYSRYKELKPVIIQISELLYSENKYQAKPITLEKLEEKIKSGKLESILIDNALNEIDRAHLKKLKRDESKNVLFVQKFNEIIFPKLNVAFLIASYLSKELSDLNESDFYNTDIPDHLINTPDLYFSQLNTIFYIYLRRRFLNNYAYLNKIHNSWENESISDEEFTKNNRAPWEVLNSLLRNSYLDYFFEGIELENFSVETSYQLIFRKTSINKRIYFSDLSSGEKIIISLIFKLFISEYYHGEVRVPDLIVLDEPDSNLHPELSYLLLRVLNETFVKKLGINVIITTHSPSTIALCPEDSIFQLENYPKTILKKVEKDFALKLMTSFIPTLSIDYKNHKQVFVESPDDVTYYQNIFDKLNQEKPFDFKLYFMSNTKGKGNCDLVKSLVKEIRSSGNQTFFGIIDWDNDNEPSEYVKVHGYKLRHTIENFMLDPLYLTTLFMEMNGAHSIYQELKNVGLNFDANFNPYLLGEEKEDDLQKIANWFFLKIESANYFSKTQKEDLVEIKYYNSKKIMVPKYFTLDKGHKFEGTVRKTFSALEKYPNNIDLKESLFRVIARSFPLIPLDSVNLIKEIIEDKA